MKLFLAAVLAAAPLAAQPFSGADAVDKVLDQAIAANGIPGAVLLIGHNGKVVYRKAYGDRAFPKTEAMTVDTMFDVASFTKVIATTPPS